jgi:hypothetical protein
MKYYIPLCIQAKLSTTAKRESKAVMRYLSYHYCSHYDAMTAIYGCQLPAVLYHSVLASGMVACCAIFDFKSKGKQFLCYISFCQEMKAFF